MRLTSLWQKPAATSRTFTSFGPGARTSTSSRIAAFSPSNTSAFMASSFLVVGGSADAWARASGARRDRHGSGVASRAQHPARPVAREGAVDDDRTPVHEHAVYAGRTGEEPSGAPGQVVDEGGVVGGHGLGIEHDHVGVVASAQH